MRQLLFMSLDAGIGAVLLAPVFLLLNKRCFHNRIRSLWYYLFAVYLCAGYSVVGLPDILYVRLDFSINLTPFAYMFSDYRSSLLNVLLFIPLGFLLPMLWENMRSPGKTVLCGFLLSLSIELLQIFTLRATDVNDLMTNTTGTLLGWCAAWLLRKLTGQAVPGDGTGDLRLILCVTFGLMFFLHPLAERLLWVFL